MPIYIPSTILIIKRANRIFPIMEPILKKYGVPDDFKYLAVIESNLTNAVSPAGARIWQFMPATARENGMEVTETVDERYHLEKATEAACTKNPVFSELKKPCFFGETTWFNPQTTGLKPGCFKKQCAGLSLASPHRAGSEFGAARQYPATRWRETRTRRGKADCGCRRLRQRSQARVHRRPRAGGWHTPGSDHHPPSG